MVTGICHYLHLRSSVGQTQFYRFTTMETLKFTAEQAESFTFPVGCPVWYFPRGKESSDHQEGRHHSIIFQGVVESVLMDLKTMQVLYHVTKDGHDVGTGPISEKDLAFAFQCPVIIMTEDEPSSEPMDGVVLHARKSNTEIQDGAVIYTVMHNVGGGYKAYKEGIEASRLKYRKVAKDEATPEMKTSPSSRSMDSPEEKVPALKSDSLNFPAHVDDDKEQPLSAITSDSITRSESNHTYSSREKSGDSIALTANLQSGHNNIPTATFTSGEFSLAKNTDGVKDPLLESGKSTTGHNISMDWDSGNAHESASSSSNKIIGRYRNLATSDAVANTGRQSVGADGTVALASRGDASANRLQSEQKKELAVARREGSEIDASNHPAKKPRSSGDVIEITIPMWLQKDKDSQGRLYSYLIGPEKDPHPVRIWKETQCEVHVLWNETSDKPMTVYITPSQISGVRAEKNLISARKKIEDLLLKFRLPKLPAIGDDGSKGRLLYEVANSYRGGHTPRGTKYGAVCQRNPFSAAQKHCCMSVLELPCTIGVDGKVFHGHFLVDQPIASKIKKKTGCSIAVFGDEMGLPVKYCDPYVLILGNPVKWSDVDRAVELVNEEIRRHQCNCDCSFIN